jgi:predicted SprT family Zn-dependent metalloprotease
MDDRLSFTRPLRPEHLIRVRELYRYLRSSEQNNFGGLPIGTSWMRMRYLADETLYTLATATQGDIPTLAIHPRAFEWNQPVLLLGLVRHELIHFVLGPEAGHGSLFRSIEEGWERFDEYKHQRAKFVRALEVAARSDGRLHRYECRKCTRVIFRDRPLKPESACDDCCQKFNNGVWSESYTLIKVVEPPNDTSEGAISPPDGDTTNDKDSEERIEEND